MNLQADPPFLAQTLSKRTALIALLGLGVVLAGIVFFDIYQDWIPGGKPLWTTLLENALPLALALSIPIVAWRTSRSEIGDGHLSTAARWSVLGGVATLIVASLGLSFQIVQGEIKPLVFVTQMIAAGALAGFLVGYSLVRLNRGASDGETADESRWPFRRMRLSKQVSLAMLLLTGAALATVVLFDVYQDWIPGGKPLWSTVAENIIPLLLALAIPAFGWRLARARGGAIYLSEATKWTLAGTTSMLVVAGSIVGLQVLQGEIKPGIILTQLATFGAAAGLFVGRSTAQARRVLRRLQGLANSVPGAVFQFEVAPDGTYTATFVSDAFETLLGLSAKPDDFAERSLQCVPRSRRRELQASVGAAVRNEEPWNVETPFEKPDGGQVHVQVIATPERHGKTTTYHGVALDVTERWEAEQELRESEERFRTLFEKHSAPMLLIDPETGAIERANAAASEFYGYDSETMTSITIQDLNQLPPDEIAAQRTDAEFRSQNRFVFPHQTRTGEIRIVEVHSTPIVVEESPLLFSVIHDITERKENEREARLRAGAMEVASDGIAILDSSGEYIYVNQAHAEVYGYDHPDAFLGEAWEMCYGADELARFEREVMPTLYENGEWRGEARGRRADGSTFPQELTLTTFGNDGIICVVRDITKRKRREREMREAKEEAEKANRMKSALMANVSHEIRTPLTSIIGFAEAMGKDVEDDDSQRHAADLIEKSGRRLMDTLNDVLNLSMLEAGEMGIDAEPVDLAGQATDAAEQMMPQAEEAGVDLQVAAGNEGRAEDRDQGPVWARADSKGVEIILNNLLSNAIKYTGEGGHVQIRAYIEEAAAVLEVEDTGIGMNPDTVEELFDAFRQESEGFDREYEGSGLGLSIIKKFTERMDGTIDVETEKGEGSRFEVHLPRANQVRGGPAPPDPQGH